LKFINSIIVLSLLIIILVDNSFSQSLFQKDNLNFEKGVPGMTPVNWVMPSQFKKLGYSAVLSDSNVFEGKFCAVITNPHTENFKIDETDANITTMYQSIDAIPYRLKKIKFKVAARLNPMTADTKGELLFIARQSKDSILLNIVDESDPIISKDWQYYEVTVDIPKNANELRYGILLKSGGALYLDDASVEIIQPENSINEAPKKLSEINIANLSTLANLYGYLRYFSPSDETLNFDWDRFLLNSISEIENTSKQDLKNKLNDLINPFKNFISINDKSDIALKYDKPKNAFKNIAYSMSYSGGPIDRFTDIFHTYRANIFASTREREASITQTIDLLRMDNMEIKINCDIKVEKTKPGSNAQIWMKADVIGKDEFVAKTTAENPVSENKWTHQTLSAKLPDNVKSMNLALIFIGEGSAWFDNVKIEIYDGNKKIKDIFPQNHSFEIGEGINNINNWLIDPAVINAGYKFSFDGKTSNDGKKSLRIDSDKESLIKFADIGKIYSYNIGSNLKVEFPIVMFTDSIHTLPVSDFSNDYKINGKPEQYQPVIEDRISRIADIIQLWNLIKHFSIENISGNILDSALNASVKSASELTNTDKFDDIIKSLLYLTNDSRYRVWNTFKSFDYSLPLIFKKLENRVLVTNVIDTSLKIKHGDEILKINDIDINYLIDSTSKYNPSINLDYKTEKALVEIRAGERDSKVKITYKNNTGTINDDFVKRTEFLNNIFDPRPPVIARLDSDVVYIDMTELFDEQFKDYFKTLKGTKVFIFDLRGASVMSEHVLGLFTKDPIKSVNWEIPIYNFPDKKNQSVKKINGGIQSRGKFEGAKVFILINDRTSGYSEAIAQIAKQNKIGTLIGTNTSGNASEVLPIRLITGICISMSAMKCFNDRNELMFNLPIKPDVVVNGTIINTLSGKDDLVQKVLQLIKE
jgi:C-terminal processing protease CtpA/Prc